ncbi:MAG: arginyltransferase [Glaciecola sp.]
MKFGVTQAFPCSYLSEHEEQLLVCMEPIDSLQSNYPVLIQAGFRRSGEQLYRPHCKQCNACESLRIIASAFTPSKSQKRIINKNKDIIMSVHDGERDDYYPLYEEYINANHSDGSMYPASYEQYRNFVHCYWQSPIFIEGRINGELVGVAVTDKLSNGLSALYSFFDPSLAKRSLGTFFILQQVQICQQMQMPYLYLGYQIDQCAKMNYKNNFYPHQRLQDNRWVLFSKKTA